MPILLLNFIEPNGLRVIAYCLRLQDNYPDWPKLLADLFHTMPIFGFQFCDCIEMHDILQRCMMLLVCYQMSKIFRIATDWTIRGSNPSRNEFPARVQTGPGPHQSSYTMVTRTSFRSVALTTYPHLFVCLFPWASAASQGCTAACWLIVLTYPHFC
jgi:hypothetical protein